MATPVDVLSVLVDADTGPAQRKLAAFDKQLMALHSETKRGIEARLGATLDPVGFERYKAAVANAARVAKEREAFKAQLGANYSPRGFAEYQRGIRAAERETIRASKAMAAAQEKAAAEAAAAQEAAAADAQKALDKRMAVASSWFKKIATAAAGIGVASVYAAMRFQAATTQLQTQAGASAKQVDELRKGMLAMASQVGATPDQLAKGMYHVVSSMNAVIPPTKRVTAELTIEKAAAEGAAIGHSNLEETSYALASAMNALHAPFTSASKVMGQMNAIVGGGDLTMTDLLDTLKTGLIPTARTFGISFQSVGAALAVMGDMGIRGAQAGTRLRMTIALLGAPSMAAAKILKAMGMSTDQVTQASNRMSALLEKAGVRTTQLAFDLRKPNGLRAALMDIQQHLERGGVSAEAASAAITRAFGGGRMGAVIQLLIQNTDRLRTKFDQIGRTTNRFNSDFAKAQKTLQQQIKDLQGGLIALGVTIGNSLIPPLTKVVTAINKFMSQMHSGAGAGGTFARDITRAFHTIRDVVRIMEPVVKGFAGVFRNTFLIIQGVVQTFAGIFTGDLSKMLRGFTKIFRGWTGAFIGFFKGVGATFYEAGKTIMHSLGRGFEDAASSVVNTVIDALNTVIGVINKAIDLINNVPGVSIGKIGKIGKVNFAGPTHTPVDSRVMAKTGAMQEIAGRAGRSTSTGRSTASKERTIASGAAGTVPAGTGTSASRVRQALSNAGLLPSAGGVGISAVGGLQGQLNRLDTQRLQLEKQLLDVHSKAQKKIVEHELAVNEQRRRVIEYELSVAKQNAATQTKTAKLQQDAVKREQAIFLAYWARIPSQGTGEQIKAAQIANQLTLATNAGNVAGQGKALNAQRRLDKQWLEEDKRKLARLNRQLARKGLSRSTHNALVQDKLALIQEIGSIESDMGTVATSLAGLTGGGTTGTIDLAPTGANVALPTRVDVRGALGPVHHHHGNVIVHVHDSGDVHKVADALEHTTGTHIHAKLRSAGLRGT